MKYTIIWGIATRTKLLITCKNTLCIRYANADKKVIFVSLFKKLITT